MKKLTIKDIFISEEIEEALCHLSTKKDTCGIDGFYLSELRDDWNINGNCYLSLLLEGKYKPGIVQIYEIVNYTGKRRSISSFNSIDRLILRCLATSLEKNYDSIFSALSFAFRPGLGVEKAVATFASNLNNGLTSVAIIDIKNFFDSIPIDRLEMILKRIIDEKVLLSLFHNFLYCRISEDNVIKTKNKGILQGSPISPFLGNLYLSLLDTQLELMNIPFCRFCDDIAMFFSNFEEAKESYKKVYDILKTDLEMDINAQKSGIYEGIKQNYLGYSFTKNKKEHQILAIKKRKAPPHIYQNWGTTAIQRIDRNYHIINNGILNRKDFTLLFENDNGKKYLPVEATESLNVYSSVIFSSNFFKYISSKKICVNIFDKYGELAGTFSPPESLHGGITMLKQAAIYLDEDKRKLIVRKLEIASLHNMRSNLKYYERHHTSEKLRNGISSFSKYITEMNEATNVTMLLTIEARARQLYYSLFHEIICDPAFEFTKRTRRPPRNPLNALISFGNVFLYNRIATEIQKTSLDIRIGFVHATNRRCQSLNLDIADLFKPLIVDRAIFTVINRHMIHASEHFEKTEDGGIYLNKEGKQIFINELENKVYQKQTEENLPRTYDTRIREEINKIFRFVCYDEKYKPFKYN